MAHHGHVAGSLFNAFSTYKAIRRNATPVYNESPACTNVLRSDNVVDWLAGICFITEVNEYFGDQPYSMPV
jgi:hypothetical protein